MSVLSFFGKAWLGPLALGCLLALLLREAAVAPDGRTHVHVLDVGQGDSILLVSPTGKQVLIDGGPDRGTLRAISARLSLFDRTIDMVVLTHPHLDHLAALPELLRRYDVGAILLSGMRADLGRYQEFLSLAEAEGATILLPDATKDIALGDGLTLDIIWPDSSLFGQETEHDPNDLSVVIRAMYGEDSVLLTGDIEAYAEAAILASGRDIDSDILKVAHHGSITSSATGFLLAASPERAVISAGRDNSFGHPNPEILDRFTHFGIPVHVTARDGAFHAVLDGR